MRANKPEGNRIGKHGDDKHSSEKDMRAASQTKLKKSKWVAMAARMPNRNRNDESTPPPRQKRNVRPSRSSGPNFPTSSPESSSASSTAIFKKRSSWNLAGSDSSFDRWSNMSSMSFNNSPHTQQGSTSSTMKPVSKSSLESTVQSLTLNESYTSLSTLRTPRSDKSLRSRESANRRAIVGTSLKALSTDDVDREASYRSIRTASRRSERDSERSTFRGFEADRDTSIRSTRTTSRRSERSSERSALRTSFGVDRDTSNRSTRTLSRRSEMSSDRTALRSFEAEHDTSNRSTRTLSHRSERSSDRSLLWNAEADRESSYRSTRSATSRRSEKSSERVLLRRAESSSSRSSRAYTELQRRRSSATSNSSGSLSKNKPASYSSDHVLKQRLAAKAKSKRSLSSNTSSSKNSTRSSPKSSGSSSARSGRTTLSSSGRRNQTVSGRRKVKYVPKTSGSVHSRPSSHGPRSSVWDDIESSSRSGRRLTPSPPEKGNKSAIERRMLKSSPPMRRQSQSQPSFHGSIEASPKTETSPRTESDRKSSTSSIGKKSSSSSADGKGLKKKKKKKKKKSQSEVPVDVVAVKMVPKDVLLVSPNTHRRILGRSKKSKPNGPSRRSKAHEESRRHNLRKDITYSSTGKETTKKRAKIPSFLGSSPALGEAQADNISAQSSSNEGTDGSCSLND
eukprot:scaffold1838_cov103-Cylindrotheca_fusiformis.AAC.5